MTIIDLPASERQAPGAGIAPVAAYSAELKALEDQTYTYIENSLALATRRAYASDWKMFSDWCDERGLQSLPASPRTVASYLTAHAGKLKTATLQRRLTTISQAHKLAGHETPTTHSAVQKTWKGIKREHGTAHAKKTALEIGDVRGMVGTLGDRLIDVRDRALVVIAFAGALRRSELVALDVEDIDVTPEGLVIHIRRSKTDQEGHGVALGLPYGSDPQTCPVRAYQAWLDASGITSGAIFRRIDRHGRLFDARISGRAAAARVKLVAAAVGHDPSRIGGHSTRRGFITSAARAKILERDIMKHSRHKSIPVFRGYVEEASVWDDNAAMGVGL